MISWMTSVSPMLIIIALVCAMIQRQHLLMVLLALETMVLGIILMIITLMNTTWLMIVIIILTFGACEASLGLACMTAMSRSYGNDHLSSMLTNKC
uniref:NADH-ubiquinone oxidoreductase chain 4L n=1 Tax=Nereis zonata TaxID=880888 RepID=A0A7M3UIY1_9ANNE|nr:NADH dehydrogenase subunit 4L [Nereis zonata]QOH99546.1 NADH dehydrogenase subunit 4L [Nereis zonata]